MLRLRSLAWIAALALLAPLALAACAGSATPALIGSYPKVIATAAPVRDIVAVYSSDLSLEVSSVDSATHLAGNIASQFGGYIAESSVWYGAGRPQAAVTLAIPVGAYNDARLAMLRLGRPTSEHIVGEPLYINNDSTRWTTYAFLVLHLTETSQAVPVVAWPSAGWSPVQTLRQALGVTTGLFTFLLNIVIWVVVVLGPFVLLGLGVRWVARQVRKQGP